MSYTTTTVRRGAIITVKFPLKGSRGLRFLISNIQFPEGSHIRNQAEAILMPLGHSAPADTMRLVDLEQAITEGIAEVSPMPAYSLAEIQALTGVLLC